jgi:hypothetical protein
MSSKLYNSSQYLNILSAENSLSPHRKKKHTIRIISTKENSPCIALFGNTKCGNIFNLQETAFSSLAVQLSTIIPGRWNRRSMFKSNETDKASFNSWTVVALFGFHKVIFNFHLASPIYHLQDISNLKVLLLCWPSRNCLFTDARMSLQANTSCNLQREKMLMYLRLSHQQLQTELSSGT